MYNLPQVGVVSDEKLLELLELAMSSDTAETVKRARELMDSGVDPMVLMSQLASLIMDIIAGTYSAVDTTCSDSILGTRSCEYHSLHSGACSALHSSSQVLVELIGDNVINNRIISNLWY